MLTNLTDPLSILVHKNKCPVSCCLYLDSM